jgi:hypothetical protein
MIASFFSAKNEALEEISQETGKGLLSGLPVCTIIRVDLNLGPTPHYRLFDICAGCDRFAYRPGLRLNSYVAIEAKLER